MSWLVNYTIILTLFRTGSDMFRTARPKPYPVQQQFPALIIYKNKELEVQKYLKPDLMISAGLKSV